MVKRANPHKARTQLLAPRRLDGQEQELLQPIRPRRFPELDAIFFNLRIVRRSKSMGPIAFNAIAKRDGLDLRSPTARSSAGGNRGIRCASGQDPDVGHRQVWTSAIFSDRPLRIRSGRPTVDTKKQSGTHGAEWSHPGVFEMDGRQMGQMFDRGYFSPKRRIRRTCRSGRRTCRHPCAHRTIPTTT